jgi:hypothetical protein
VESQEFVGYRFHLQSRNRCEMKGEAPTSRASNTTPAVTKPATRLR